MWLLIHLDHQVFSCKTPALLARPQHIPVRGVNPPQEQDFALLSVELADVSVGPFFRSVVVPLNGTTFICFINNDSQFCIICKFLLGHEWRC